MSVVDRGVFRPANFSRSSEGPKPRDGRSRALPARIRVPEVPAARPRRPPKLSRCPTRLARRASSCSAQMATTGRDVPSGAGHAATALRAVSGARGGFQKRGRGALLPERPTSSDVVTPPAKVGRGGTVGAGSRPGRRDRTVVENSQWDRRGRQLRALGHAMTIYLDEAARLRVCPTGQHPCGLRLKQVACRPCSARACHCEPDAWRMGAVIGACPTQARST